MAHSDLIKSLLHGLDVLSIIGRYRRGWRLNELAEKLQLTPGAVHNILRTLSARGFVDKDGVNYFPGPVFLELAQQEREHSVLQQAGGWLLKLAKLFPGIYFTFSELDENCEIRCRLRCSPDRPGILQHDPPLYFVPFRQPTALALQSSSSRADGLEKRYPFAEFGAGCWSSPAAFQEEKNKILRLGYAYRCMDNYRYHAAFVLGNYALGVSRKDADGIDFETLKEYIEDLIR